MPLPIVRMETTSYPNLTLTFATGDAITVTNGRANVPWRSVAEAIAKNFIVSDPAVKYPPAKGAMCPPTPLSVARQGVTPTAPQQVPFPIPIDINAAAYPNNTYPMGPPGSASGGPGGIETKFAPAWRPAPDPTPAAQLTLPDGSVIYPPYPGSNYIEIPEKHIAYFKTQGWLLLSENM